MSYRYTEADALALQNRNTRAVKKASAPQITERDVTTTIRQLLRICNIWHFKHWAGPMSEQGIADILGCQKITPVCPHCQQKLEPIGRFMAIELKRPGGALRLMIRLPFWTLPEAPVVSDLWHRQLRMLLRDWGCRIGF